VARQSVGKRSVTFCFSGWYGRDGKRARNHRDGNHPKLVFPAHADHSLASPKRQQREQDEYPDCDPDSDPDSSSGGEGV
jgi:hypothetical protein